MNDNAKESKPTTYTWPHDGHFLFAKNLTDTIENRLKLHEELSEFMEKHAKHEVIFMRRPPEMQSSSEFGSEVKMVSLCCRFSVAERNE